MSLKVASTLELAGVEKFFCSHGNWYIIAYAAHLTGDHLIIANNAIHAIQCLLKRHSRMRTRIRIEDQRYLLDVLDYDIDSLPIDKLFSIIDATDHTWQQIVENRCNQNPYSDDGSIDFPLFHFMLVLDRQSSTTSDTNLFHLVVFANHCVADGRSGYILIHEFLTLVTSPDLNQTSELINTDILSFIHQLIPRPFGHLYPLASFTAKHLYIRELKKLRQLRIPIKSIPLTDGPPKQFDIPQYRTKFLFSSSSSDLYRHLREQCHSHEVTMNGPLVSCLLLAIHRCFPLKNNNRLKPFAVGTPFDMRSRLSQSSPLTLSSVGFFIGMSDVKLGRSLSMQSTQFWRLAQKCMRITQKQLNRNGIPLGMHAYADIMRDNRTLNDVIRQFPDGRVGELALSNIGKYPFSCNYNQGQIRLHGIHIANSASVFRASLVVFVTCAGDSQLDFSLTHELESDENAKEFLDYYVRLVEACADVERCTAETTLEELLQSVESK